ncbi:bile acid:sodium symporter [Pacificibacter marinus]|nr:bile acid:sodium symporter [Pacificibacter marinus]
MGNLPPSDIAVLFYCGSTKSVATGLPIATALFASDVVGAIVLPLMIYHMSQRIVCAFVSKKRYSNHGERTSAFAARRPLII